MKPSASALFRQGGSDEARVSTGSRKTRGILGHDRLTERNKLFVGGGACLARRALSALHSSLWTSPGGVTMVKERPSLPGSSMSGGVLIRTASCLVISSTLQYICRIPYLPTPPGKLFSSMTLFSISAPSHPNGLLGEHTKVTSCPRRSRRRWRSPPARKLRYQGRRATRRHLRLFSAPRRPPKPSHRPL